MSELTQYLEAIKEEKENKLIPENIKSGVTILGVPGGSGNFIKADVSKLSGEPIYKAITEINNLDTTEYLGDSLNNLFSGLINLKKVSFKNTDRIVNMSSLFANCQKLEKIDFSKVNTSNVTNMTYMFSQCYSLVEIPQIDTSKVKNMYYMFGNGCTKLSNESLNNILAMCINATSYTGAKTLATLGLTKAQATTCQTLSNWSAAEAAGWTTGY